jgi:hypothetical protein
MTDSKDQKVIETALKRFKLIEDAEHDIRKKSLDDLKFREGSGQWDDVISEQRRQDRRPCLTSNRIPQFVRHITNDMRMNRPSIKISATDDTTKETAEILEGLMRHIQESSNASIAYDTAADNQVTMGFGYVRVITDYCDDDTFDQEILIKPIKNPFTVYFDPNCVEFDYSDAMYAFVCSDVDKGEFQKQYPDANQNNELLSSIGDSQANWETEDTIRIVEYFDVVEKDKKLYQLIDGSIVDKLPEGMPKEYVKAERSTKDRKIIWRKMTATDILEEKEWVGKYIPIVPFLGEDLDVDGKRVLKGIVRDAQDPQRMYNYWVTAQTEAIALAPRAPFLVAEGQIEGYEKFWNTANTSNHAYLPYKPVTLNGNIVGAPQRQQAEPPVQAMTLAIRQASEDLKLVTGIQDAALGVQSNETSGKAIQQRQKQGEIANFHFGDNFARGLRALGTVIMDLIPKIYDAPRVTRIIHPDDTEELVKINQPTGKKDMNGVDKIYDVTTGKYDVVISVGASFQTKRQEAADAMVAITQANPNLWQVAGDLLVKNLDWNGSDEIAERLKKMLPPQLQEKPDGSQELPPQVQQQLAQLEQMNEQLTAALNQANDVIDAKKEELESRERIANSNNDTKVVLEIIKQETTANHALMMAELQKISQREALSMQQTAPAETPQNQPVDNQII